MSAAFVRNLIEKALYECMHIELTDDPDADHLRRIAVWEDAMRQLVSRCAEISEDYAACQGLIDECDQEICDGIRDTLRKTFATQRVSRN